MTNRTLEIGKVYRYARPYRPAPPEIDAYPNYFYVTETPGNTMALLDAGINPIREVPVPEDTRSIVILISSSPHKISTEGTPWQNFFDTDNGHIRYYGDNKIPGADPTKSSGNKVLLKAFQVHSALESHLRAHGVPLLFLKRVGRKGRRKGFVRFEGFGIIDRAEHVTQYDQSNDRTFSNDAFDFFGDEFARRE